MLGFLTERGNAIARFEMKLLGSRKGAYELLVSGLDREMVELFLMLGLIELKNLQMAGMASSGIAVA